VSQVIEGVFFMDHTASFRCDCCGLAIDLSLVQVCPACQYPVATEQEQEFLETSIHDLRRVMNHGGASIRVADLVHRYECRLSFLRSLNARSASALPLAERLVVSAHPSVARTRPLPVLGQADGGPLLLPPDKGIAVQPAASMRGFSLSSDAIVNILAALGSFLILAGALGFTLTTPNLWVSFAGMFLLQGISGGAGLLVQRRFPLLRTVATLYTFISALLIPLVGFSAYRLVSGGTVAFSPPLLLTLAACYAAAVYGLLAVVQRFVPFAYLGVVALLISDLALAETLHLAMWWWPCAALVLALASLGAVSRPSGARSLFAEARAILRTPLAVLMYTVVAAGALLLLLLLGDSFLEPLAEKRLALFSLSCLILAWSALWIWRTGRVSLTPALAYLLLVTLLLLGYTLDLERTGYVLLLACVALGYHILARIAQSRRSPGILPALALDQLATGVSLLVLLLVAFALPFQLLEQSFSSNAGLGRLLFPGLTSFFVFVPEAGISLDVLASGLCLLVTLDITVMRAGWTRTPARAAWCWLLLPGGLLLTSMYGLLVLLWGVAPLWAWLALSLVLLAGAVLTRRFVGPFWANPLDVLALGQLLFTLLLSLSLTPEVVSVFLLGYAALLYAILLSQRRPWPSVLPACLLLCALPLFLTHVIVVLCISLLLPPVCAWIQRAGLFSNTQRLLAWTLLVPALIYGLVLAGAAFSNDQSVLVSWLHLHLSVAYDLAALGLTWYAAALVAREKLWLVPATLFWLLALFLPFNNFWALSVLTPVLAILAAVAQRRLSLAWALPLYLAALFSSAMVAYTGFLSQHFTALSWIGLGFALLAYTLGLLNGQRVLLWVTPVYTTLAILTAGLFLGDLFRLPLVAFVGAGLGLLGTRVSLPLFCRQHWQAALQYTLPLYITALVAAVLTGIAGTLGAINRPFYGAVPDVLLLDALVAFVVLRIEQRPRWCWLVAVFASWGVLLMQQLTPAYVLGAGTALLLSGLLSRSLLSAEHETAGRRWMWSWPWYLAFLVAALVFDSWPLVVDQSAMTGLFALGALAFTALATLAMVIERAPEFLFIPVSQAAWTIHLGLPGASPAALILAYTFLCILIFVTQFIWQFWPAHTRWLPATSPHNLLSLGGLCLVLSGAVSQGALSPDTGILAQTGVLALVTLSLLVFLYGLTHFVAVTHELSQQRDEQHIVQRVESARAVHHVCSYGSGLLLTLAACWELLAFHQTNLDMLTLVPASYLIIVAPFLFRDQILPARQITGQLVSLVGAALLLLPALWLSFNGILLLPTLVLLAESLVLLVLGLIIRLRIFILSSAALVVAGTLRLLFLSVPQSVPILLMVFGSLLVLLATGLILARHRLQHAWRRWE
jgi:hypothetical protein